MLGRLTTVLMLGVVLALALPASAHILGTCQSCGGADESGLPDKDQYMRATDGVCGGFAPYRVYFRHCPIENCSHDPWLCMPEPAWTPQPNCASTSLQGWQCCYKFSYPFCSLTNFMGLQRPSVPRGSTHSTTLTEDEAVTVIWPAHVLSGGCNQGGSGGAPVFTDRVFQSLQPWRG